MTLQDSTITRYVLIFVRIRFAECEGIKDEVHDDRNRERDDILRCMERLKCLGPKRTNRALMTSIDMWLTKGIPSMRAIAFHPAAVQGKDVQFPCVSLNMNRRRQNVDSSQLMKAIHVSMDTKVVAIHRKSP